MARKLNPTERQVFDEIVRESEANSVELSSENYSRRLNEQSQGSSSLGQLALWLSEDPLSPH